MLAIQVLESNGIVNVAFWIQIGYAQRDCWAAVRHFLLDTNLFVSVKNKIKMVLCTGKPWASVWPAIWLILPELMCSFQRLSHACISINDLFVKPRTAHYNSYNLLEFDNPTWIPVVILALIHAPKLRPRGKSAFIRTKPHGFGRPMLTQNN